MIQPRAELKCKMDLLYRLYTIAYGCKVQKKKQTMLYSMFLQFL